MADKVYPLEEGFNSPPPSAPPISGSAVASKPTEQQEQEQQQEKSVHKTPEDVIYKTPTPLPSNHPSHRPRRRHSPCCCCLAWLSGVLATIVVVLGITALVLYLVLQPKAPKFSVTNASISAFNLTNQSSDASVLYLQAAVVFTVEAENPNKKIGIYYDEVDVILYYDGTEIGTGSLPPFYQGHKNTTLLQLEMKGDTPLTPAIGTVLQTAVTSDNSISLQVKTTAHVRVKVGSWKSGVSKFKVNCDVEISNPVSGSTRLLSKSCKLKVQSIRL